MKIVSVKDKRIKALVEDPTLTAVRGLDRQQVGRILDMLSAIKAMTHPLQLTTVSTWRAHELKPGQPGKWSLTVNRNYRLTFLVVQEAQEVHMLDYEDYH